MAYIYRHIDKKTNLPFYIGIGSDDEGKYKRANDVKRRSFSWKDIAYKNGYEIEILLDNLSWDEVCLKEKEFIELYGRKDLKEGNLINFTNGGEGQFGRKDSEQTLLRKRKPKTESAKINMKLSHNNRNYDYLKNKAGAKIGVKKSKTHSENIGLGHKNHPCYKDPKFGLKVSKGNLGKSKEKLKKPIIQYDLNMVYINEFDSVSEACMKIKISKGNISSVLTGKLKQTCGFIFKYKK